MIFKGVWDDLVQSAFHVVDECPWLDAELNKVAINSLVNVAPHRPHRWSTVSDYTSWESLTDQRWSARALPATYLQNLPDTKGLVEMFRRPTGEQRLCPKSTCLFPAFAQYLTDGFIRTRMPVGDEPQSLRRQNTSNHQIDLSPLYGRIIAQTNALRLMSEASGQRGRLKSQIINGEEYPPFLFIDENTVNPDFTVLDPPLGLDMPGKPDPNPQEVQMRPRIFAVGGDRVNSNPQVAMMNTLFLREHNRLAGLMEQSNPGWDDERVFQTARNTLIALFIKIVVEEYINHISPAPFRLIADPSVAWSAPWNKPNWITTEFSLLYRWHSLILDTLNWSGNKVPVWETLFNNQLLINAGLTQAFTDLSAQQAAQLGAFNTADALLPLEQFAIDQGRLVNLAPYTDYRAHVGMERPASISDISPDARVVEFLTANYASVNDVDFYIGLFAEPIVKNSPLPTLLSSMVAVDAFSQALTNPLLSEHVFNPDTFSPLGWDTINATHALRDVLARNTAGKIDGASIGMTLSSWKWEC